MIEAVPHGDPTAGFLSGAILLAAFRDSLAELARWFIGPTLSPHLAGSAEGRYLTDFVEKLGDNLVDLPRRRCSEA
jgi:hypothetical protein